MTNYETWIQEWNAALPEGRTCYGMCYQASTAMVEAHPELELVKGHIYDAAWGKRAHWWCKTTTGEIVDPTAAQFPALYEYEEYQEGDEVRVGRCMNCGEDIWAVPTEPHRSSMCSDACEAEMRDSLTCY